MVELYNYCFEYNLLKIILTEIKQKLIPIIIGLIISETNYIEHYIITIYFECYIF